MPDDELFALAATGKLREKGVVSGQIKRMLADPKADQLVRNFGGQWLSVRDFGLQFDRECRSTYRSTNPQSPPGSEGQARTPS